MILLVEGEGTPYDCVEQAVLDSAALHAYSGSYYSHEMEQPMKSPLATTGYCEDQKHGEFSMSLPSRRLLH